MRSNRRAAPKISLCMIAKDEARFIEDCLRAVEGAVDEIVLVDTGSTDGTVDLARPFGVSIYEFPWCDDFAAARNESIRHATGDWILWLDADELLASGGGAVLRGLVQRDDFDFAYMPMYNAARLDASPDEVLSGAARLGEPFML